MKMFKTTALFTLTFSIFLLVSCSESSTSSDTDPNPTNETEETEITTGTLEITTITQGKDLDEDGYTISVGDDSKSIDSDDTVTFENLEEDSYEIELSELASNCLVDGDNPRNVEINAEETTSVEFLISCESDIEPIAGK